MAFGKFATEVGKDLPILQGLIGALLGARVGALFGPMGALVGAGVGGVAPGMIEHGLNPDEPHSADVWGAVKGWWSSHAPTWAGGQSGQAAPATQSEQTAAMRLMDRLIKVHGWTPEAAAIAAGNAQQESSIRSDGPAGDGGISHGMFQWNHERFEALQAFAASRGKNWQDFDTQVDFLDAEARGKVPTWPSQHGLGMAGAISHAYEGFGDDFRRDARRQFGAMAQGLSEPNGSGANALRAEHLGIESISSSQPCRRLGRWR